jgi:hypothetical protein
LLLTVFLGHRYLRPASTATDFAPCPRARSTCPNAKPGASTIVSVRDLSKLLPMRRHEVRSQMSRCERSNVPRVRRRRPTVLSISRVSLLFLGDFDPKAVRQLQQVLRLGPPARSCCAPGSLHGFSPFSDRRKMAVPPA